MKAKYYRWGFGPAKRGPLGGERDRPRIERVLIVYKKSSFEKHAIVQKDTNYLRLLRKGDPAIRRSKRAHDTHTNTFNTVRRHLRELKIPFDVKSRYKLTGIRSCDLVLTIGGDGTFLAASHYLRDGLIMGINSVPQDSVGYFCRATSATFEKKLHSLLQGKATIRTLHRLKITMDGVPLGPFSLNDVLFANTNPAATTRYVLRVGHIREEQKSSGLWISPAPGSTAATSSAGGKVLPLEAKEIQYVVREAYSPPGKSYRLVQGVLGDRAVVEIISLMDEAALFIDGHHRVYNVPRGSRIAIRNAHQPIRAVW